MRILALFFVLGLLAVSGCARDYVITLNNGARITAASKPRLKDGVYVFKDAEGLDSSVPAGRVSEIAPASMAREKDKSFYLNPSN